MYKQTDTFEPKDPSSLKIRAFYFARRFVPDFHRSLTISHRQPFLLASSA